MTSTFTTSHPPASPSGAETGIVADAGSGSSPRTARGRRALVALAAAGVVVGAVYPALQPRFWSWDWYWVDQCAREQCGWGGPFYDLFHHANPLPVEVQWYRVMLAAFGNQGTAHHALALLGLLGTLALLYCLTRLLGVPSWSGGWAVVLAGVAPAALTSWTWFAASPHLWAALLGLGSACLYLRWRQLGSCSTPLLVGSLTLAVLGLAMKNDAVIGPLLAVAWDWLGPDPQQRPRRIRMTAVNLLPVAVFVWWQFTAVDPHRDQARTSLTEMISNAVGLLRFSFLWRREAELRAEFPPGPSVPITWTAAGFLVGALVLGLAAVSLRQHAGRVLVSTGLCSLGPVAVLHPALVSRYVLPPTLLITAAAGVGAATLIKHRPRSGAKAMVLICVGAATVLSWALLTHHASGAGEGAGREEQALLAGLTHAGLRPTDNVKVRLVSSPLEPSTAEYRQLDPALPTDQRLARLTFLEAGEQPPAGVRVAVATRLASGTYQVTIIR